MSAAHGRLSGKTALITGAGSGIGYAIAKRFLEEGARIAAIGRRPESLERWAGVSNAVPVRADITQAGDIARMVEETERAIGSIDIVCNVAGMNDLCYPLLDTTDERWDSVLDLDLKAPFRICRAIVPGMVERGRGVILNVGSYAALRGNHGPSYTAAKAGLTGLTLSIAVAYAKSGVRCNVINPGGVRTEIGTNSGGEYHPKGITLFSDIVTGFPVPWVCDPEDIAPVAAFLCSDDAKHVNGAVVAVDGGMSAC